MSHACFEHSLWSPLHACSEGPQTQKRGECGWYKKQGLEGLGHLKGCVFRFNWWYVGIFFLLPFYLERLSGGCPGALGLLISLLRTGPLNLIYLPYYILSVSQGIVG